ncbi:MAG: rhodanese-like domain-containing protein [Anaerolineae bacterium]
MITVRMDRRVLYGILGVVAVLVVLGLGFALGKAVNPSSSAQVAASQSASQSASQAQKPAQAIPTPQYDPTAIAAANAQLSHVPRINLDDAKQKLTDPNVLFVDARSAQEFAQGHIKGAVSVPVNEVDKYLSRLPQDKELIVYCA